MSELIFRLQPVEGAWMDESGVFLGTGNRCGFPKGFLGGAGV